MTVCGGSSSGVLALYWSREVVSMLAAAPLVSHRTRVMLMLSCVYHLVKITLVGGYHELASIMASKAVLTALTIHADAT